MPSNETTYRVILRASPPHGYEAGCSDFEGCSVTAPTQEEAVRKIREAIAFYLESCPCDQVKPEALQLTLIQS